MRDSIVSQILFFELYNRRGGVVSKKGKRWKSKFKGFTEEPRTNMLVSISKLKASVIESHKRFYAFLSGIRDKGDIILEVIAVKRTPDGTVAYLCELVVGITLLRVALPEGYLSPLT